MKKILFATLLAFSIGSYAQLDLGLDVQSRYIWRGLQLGGNSASAQPHIEYATGKFSFGAWGAYNLGGTGNGNETDLYMTYSLNESVSFTLTDYFFPGDGNNQGYTPYNSGHVLEVMISYSSKGGFDLTVATNLGGAIKYDDGGNKKSAYSTYVELSYGKTVGNIDYSLFAGAVFGDDNGYYFTDGSGFINLGLSASKEIQITEKWTLPVNAALIFNPDAENIFITFGLSL